MSTFVLLHGAGSDPWYWHLVAPELRAHGHDVVAPALPVDDEAAQLDDYVDVVVDAIDGHRDVVLVAQSLAGLVAPVACTRAAVDLLVLLAAMVPAPGETGGDWWQHTGHRVLSGVDPDDLDALFLHDVPAAVAAESAAHLRPQTATVFEQPSPLGAWPDVPTRFLLCRDDRFFPADFQRRVVRERLGFEPDEMDGGHLPALAHPHELATRLLVYRDEV
jgi:hypothetical protein